MARAFSIARRAASQLLIRNSGHLDVDVDPVEQRAADLAEVLLDLPGRAAALSRGVAVEHLGLWECSPDPFKAPPRLAP